MLKYRGLAAGVELTSTASRSLRTRVSGCRASPPSRSAAATARPTHVAGNTPLRGRLACIIVAMNEPFRKAPSRLRSRCFVAPFLAYLLLGVPLLASDETLHILEQYRKTKQALRPHFYDFAIGTTAGSAELLDQQWSLIAKWCASYFSTHPGARPEELKTAIRNLDVDLRDDALQLDQQTYVVSVQQGEVGTVFVVHSSNGEFIVPWRINDVRLPSCKPKEGAYGIECWSAKNAQAPASGRRCGPLYGTVGSLPKRADGTSGFYVDATFAQEAGATVGGQLSVWNWDGRSAKCEFVDTYAYMIDTPGGHPYLADNVLHLRTKETFKTIFSCGGCSEPGADWSLRITPGSVQDEGRRRLVPELDVIDELHYRIQRRLPTSDMASRQVVQMLAPLIEDVRPKLSEDPYQPIGMLFDWKVKRGSGKTSVCISTDGLGRFLYTIDKRGNRLYVSNVKSAENINAGKDCTEVLARSSH